MEYKTINIPIDLHRKLKIEATQKGISLADLINARLDKEKLIEKLTDNVYKKVLDYNRTNPPANYLTDYANRLHKIIEDVFDKI